MAKSIKIGQKTISLLQSGRDANWAFELTTFMEAVSEQLLTISSEFDLAPKVQTLTTDSNINLNLEQAIFPSGSVRSFGLEYTIYRINNTTSIIESGTITGIYNSLTSTWSLVREFEGNKKTDGTSYHSFQMSGDQVQLTTDPIGGVYNGTISTISYSAKTILTNSI